MDVLFVGDRAFSFPKDGNLLRIKASKVTPLTVKASSIFPFPVPPYVVFTLNDKKNEQTCLTLTTLFRFTDGKLTSIPWQCVVRWAVLTTLDQGVAFLSALTLGSTKHILKRTPVKGVPVERGLHSTCCNSRHRANCGTSVTILSTLVDEDYYAKFNLTMCTKCVKSDEEGSQGGYFNLVTSLPILRHMQPDPRYSHLVDMLLILGTTTKENLNFYRYGQGAGNSLALTKEVLFSGNISLVKVARWPGAFHDFNLHVKELNQLVKAAASYLVFGTSCPMFTALTPEPTVAHQFELIPISVTQLNSVVDIFRDKRRRASTYTHVYTDKPLDIPGVLSIHVTDLDKTTTSTLVLWPAHTFNLLDLKRAALLSFKQPVILAGIPYVLDHLGTHSHLFTDFCIQQSLEPPTTNKQKYSPLDGFKPSRVPTNMFIVGPNPVPCPAHTWQGHLYYNRYLLTTLLYTHGPVSVVPGKVDSLLALAL